MSFPSLWQNWHPKLRVSVLYNLWVCGVVVQLTQYRLQCIHMSGSVHRTTLNEQ